MSTLDLKIGIIGVGVVGGAIAALLNDRGYLIHGLSSRDITKVTSLAAQLNCKVIKEPTDLVKDCDVVFITTPDSIIGDICIKAERNKVIKSKQYIIHMSGALTSEVLHSAKESGAYVLSMHPLQSFASLEEAIKNIPNSYFALEGDKEAIILAEEIVKGLEGIAIEINKESKPIYHAAACVASNYLVALANLSIEFLAKANFTEDQAQKALLPLIKGTINNIEKLGTIKALTGPIARGDYKTVENHLKALGLDPEKNMLYRQLGAYTTKIALKKGTITTDTQSDIEKLLLEGVKS